MGRRRFAKRTAAGPDVEPALGLVGGPHDDIDDAVAAEIAGFDHPGQIGCGSKDRLTPIVEAAARAIVDECEIGFGSARLRVVPPVREKKVGTAIAVDVGDLDLVRPLRGVPDRLRSDIEPKGRARRRCLGLGEGEG